MRKTAMLSIRVDSEVKDLIEAAATAAGQSLSAFVVEAASKAAARVKGKANPARTFGGVPHFFRALCATAKAGGEQGYHTAGYELTRHVDRLTPSGMTDREWGNQREALAALCKRGNKAAIVEWFSRNYPRCIELVPTRRRQQFADGVRQCVDDNGI